MSRFWLIEADKEYDLSVQTVKSDCVCTAEVVCRIGFETDILKNRTGSIQRKKGGVGSE